MGGIVAGSLSYGTCEKGFRERDSREWLDSRCYPHLVGSAVRLNPGENSCSTEQECDLVR